MKKFAFAALAALGIALGSMAIAVPSHAAATHYGSQYNVADGGNG